MQYHITLATSGLKFTGNTLENKALGGSETAFIYLAKELAKMGHVVTCYCQCTEEGLFEGVQYCDLSKWNAFVTAGYADITIVSRFHDLFSHKINSKLNILWEHDILPDEIVGDLMSVMWNIDYLYCLSDYHKNQYMNASTDFKNNPDFIKLTSNAIDHSLCVELPKKHKIMYTSRPERGLYKALELYERLDDKELELLVCNYNTIKDEQVKQIELLCNDKILELKEKGFNITGGQFTKEELYKHISESKAVIYPTEFPEIFCISGIEAQANGTPFITTHDFAMTETVEYEGIKLVDNYDDRFFRRMKKVIYNDNLINDIGIVGRDYVKKYSWENVAKTFINDADSFFSDRFHNNRKRVYERLMHDSEYVNLRDYLLKNSRDEELKEKINHDLRFVDGKESLKEIYEEEETHEKIDMSLEQMELNGRFKWLNVKLKEHKEIKTVLDYACHMGGNTIVNAKRNPDIQFIGYDISEKAINKAKKRAEVHEVKNVLFTSNIDDLEQYDALFCGEYLEHTLNPEKEIDRLEKYVKDGGKMFFTVPMGAWESLSREQNKKLDVVYHVQSFDHRDIDDMFSNKTDYTKMVMSMPSYFDPYGYSLGNFLIEYTKDKKGTGKRDFKRKLLTTRPLQKMAACIIAKNAEKSIESMLDSMKDFNGNYIPDEIIVINDNSTDETKERCLKRGCKVYDIPQSICEPDYWGFANARNYSISKTDADWIFWIDSDEMIYNLHTVKRHLETSFMNAFVIKQHHAQLDSFIEADRPQRIFRKSKGKFFGYIHEQAQDINNFNNGIEPALIMQQCDIVNLGSIKEHERRTKSIDRNLPLLDKDWNENVVKKQKKGQQIRKLTPILVMRDYLNRIFYNIEEFGTAQTKDVKEFVLPRIFKLKKEYIDKEDEQVYIELADDVLQKVYELCDLGEKTEIKMRGKLIQKRYLDIEDLIKDIENLCK